MKLLIKFSLTLVLTLNLGQLFVQAGVLDQSIQDSLQTLENLNTSNKQHCSSDGVTESVACESISGLNSLIEEAINKKDWKKRNDLKDKLQRNYSQCLDDRFIRCYPKLKNSIPLKELNSLFKNIKSDPKFRYSNGGMGMCHYRAENLSYFLAEAGFKTKTVRIGHSPTLIAMDRNIDGSFTGNYDDYHGAHTLVQIDVVVNGKTIPYLLDPQYMEEALPREDYFKRTMGQDCQQLGSEDDEYLDLTKCYYSEQKQNKSAEDLLTMFYTINSEEDKPFKKCGWASGHKAKSINENPKVTSSTKKDKIINCNNGETPKKFQNQKVTNSTYKELIGEAYSSYENKLKKQLELAREQVRMSKTSLDQFTDKTNEFYKEQLELYQDWQKRKDKLEFSLNSIPEMKKRVQANLK